MVAVVVDLLELALVVAAVVQAAALAVAVAVELKFVAVVVQHSGWMVPVSSQHWHSLDFPIPVDFRLPSSLL